MENADLAKNWSMLRLEINCHCTPNRTGNQAAGEAQRLRRALAVEGAQLVTNHQQESSDTMERAVIGSLLLNPGQLEAVQGVGLQPTDFALHRHRLVYAAICALTSEQIKPDFVTVGARLQEQEHNTDLGDPKVLEQLSDPPVSPLYAEEYAKLVLDASLRRSMKDTAQKLLSVSSNPKLSISQRSAEARQLSATLEASMARGRKAGGTSSTKNVWTTLDLLQADFPEPNWTVKDLIPVGLSILAGRPKVGKSWLAMQIATAVGTGGQVLDRDIPLGKAIYIAFEDKARRLKQRLNQQGASPNADVTWLLNFPTVRDGGLDALEQQLKDVIPSFVVIDTLGRFLTGFDPDEATDMTQALGPIQMLAHETNTAILLVDHQRKPSGMLADPVDDTLGSTAKTAVADTCLGLYRDRGNHTTRLMVRGRDVEDQDLELSWDGYTCSWLLLGETGKVKTGSFQQKVFNAVRELEEQGEVPTTTKLANLLDSDRGQISRALAELVAKGSIIKGDMQGNERPYYAKPPLSQMAINLTT